jgi:hypothetical protein
MPPTSSPASWVLRWPTGTEAEAGPGSVAVIESGHDAWTVGDEPRVFIDFGESVAQDAARE